MRGMRMIGRMGMDGVMRVTRMTGEEGTVVDMLLVDIAVDLEG